MLTLINNTRLSVREIFPAEWLDAKLPLIQLKALVVTLKLSLNFYHEFVMRRILSC